MERYTPEKQAEIAMRVRGLLDDLNLRQQEVARRIEADPTNFSKTLRLRQPLTGGFVNSMVAHMGLSRDWLVDGTGEPYAAEPGVTSAAAPVGVPVYDIDVCAGCTELSMMFTDDRVIGRVQLPRLSGDSAIVRVSGDSMEPVIMNGGYVAIRPVTDTRNIFWGQIYVVVMDDYRLVKFVRRSAGDADRVILHSANADYDDMDVAKEDIRRLFLVEAVLNCTIRC